ncbi:[FeFe] hydrogenase H-cluster radical SAM maturase HydG [uncultured Candidatus Kuenenia sp.]|uniref:[FeFe] hydrogenase H-cluster radical SAM maturase HydG n=1 Tax=uncultured Candidatus Kuenenia sp. TaxID=1048336 RepID=UPI0025F32B2E|nr:[FeFe] hydrogenase H-cluster radical SAM maturase HydG [uncultured Candidatus Kuenenia sp.]
MQKTFIDEDRFQSLLTNTPSPSTAMLADVLKKGRELKGLTPEEAAMLINVIDLELTEEIFDAARYIKNAVYGSRLVFFAPLYISNYCVNDCLYCGFRAGNPAMRKKLTMDEVREQTGCLIEMGHKRVLLEAGEDIGNNPVDYILDAIDAIYSVRNEKGEIRRVNVNIAATTAENYRRLKAKGIGTYQLFQESYHRPTYEKIHNGPKSDYQRQLYALDKAFEGGIDDVGMGVLFGLYDWRYEVLGLISHAAYLFETFRTGPHTISVPRLRPAHSVNLRPPSPVSDSDFLRLIAILRIAVPYTGMIITTRESPEIREAAFRIGITQASAASSTTPGGLGKGRPKGAGQFELSDNRSLEEITVSAMKEGFMPSFCTACYRRGRTGAVFMELARPGDIQEFCGPNSILTLMEYMEDNASPESRHLGLEIINKTLDAIENASIKKQTEDKLARIRNGERDLFF